MYIFIQGSKSKSIVQGIEHVFESYTKERRTNIHLKKKNDFVKDVNKFMANNRKFYD